MSEVPREEPEWVQRLRARGYNVRVGTLDEPMSEIPEAMFDPPIRTRFGGIRRGMAAVMSAVRKLFRHGSSNRQARHAPLP